MEISQDAASKLDKNNLRSAQCLLISLYRLLWGEYYVHRPHFTGRPSELGVKGSSKVPLFTGPPWQVPSQPISHYRPLLVKKMKNKFQPAVHLSLKMCPSNEFGFDTPATEAVICKIPSIKGKLITF